MTELKVETLDKEWYDATKITSFRTCPQKYYWRHERGLLSNDGFAPELSFGIAIHKALETVYKGTWADIVPINPNKPDHSRFPTARPGYMRLMFREFLDHFPYQAEHKDRTQEIGLRLLAAYTTKWQSEPFKVICIEQAFCLDFEDFYYVGRIDLGIDWDELMPLDHKTTTRFGQFFEGAFKLDVAMTGYMIALGRLLGRPCNKGVINALRVTSKIDEQESFMRKITTRSTEDFAKWELDLRQTVDDIRHCRVTDNWPLHANSCFAYMRECEYRTLDTSSKQQREEMIPANYTVDLWDPL